MVKQSGGKISGEMTKESDNLVKYFHLSPIKPQPESLPISANTAPHHCTITSTSTSTSTDLDCTRRHGPRVPNLGGWTRLKEASTHYSALSHLYYTLLLLLLRLT